MSKLYGEYIPPEVSAVVEGQEITVEIREGLKGDEGDKGDPGEGLPPGGVAGQIIEKVDDVDYNTQWADNYSHPATHSLDMITETALLKIMTADERDRLATLGGIPI